MILNHLLNLYDHSRTEQQTIENLHESFMYSLMHILVVSLIPAICGYFATAHIGWTIGVGDPIKTSQSSALLMAIAIYIILVISVFSFAYLIQWMAKRFNAVASFIQSLELAAYSATPMLMVGVVALLPIVWFVALAYFSAISYSIYLLYSGVPIMMNIPKGNGFIYSSAVVACGLILLVGIIAFSSIMWSMGFGSEYFS